jgi:hypothetical protein
MRKELLQGTLGRRLRGSRKTVRNEILDSDDDNSGDDSTVLWKRLFVDNASKNT